MKRPSSRPLRIKILRLPHAKDLQLPAYQTVDAAGMDLVAAVAQEAPIVLQPGQRTLVPTGLVFELPPGTEAQVRPRSGLAIKSGVTVLNSPGTIDADYRGEVSVILINLSDTAFAISRGDRIAQLVFAPVTQAKLVETRTLSATARGSGGFGSTGIERRKNQAKTLNRKPIAPNRKSAKTTPSKVKPKSR